jgi:two-component system chemotaxis response regulator CheY
MNEILEKCAGDIKYNGLKKDGTAHRVLVVDDAMFIRKTISKIITAVGYELAGEAENGLDAIEKYEQLLPSLVTMDITMPKMEGIDAVREILKKHPEARIVMVSAMGYQKLVKESIVAGAKNFIVKPIKEENVQKTLEIFKWVAGD